MNEAKVVPLEDPGWHDATILVVHRGVLMPVSRERLRELLRHEERYFELLATVRGGEPAPAPAPPVGEGVVYVAPSLTPAALAVTHAALSNRVKRIHSYAQKAKKLRPMHAQLLAESVELFDWKMPKHPKTKLETHLSEISGWRSVDPDLRRRLDDFLRRYLSARGLDR